MGEIYSNSYLTIFADKAAADVEGFLKPRKRTYIHLDAIGLNDEMVRVALLDHTIDDMMKSLKNPRSIAALGLFKNDICPAENTISWIQKCNGAARK
jgi:hypothetical protein